MASGTISFELSTDITYVAGTVNGVETVFIQDEAYPVKWRAAVDVAEDSLYHIYLEMYDEAGNKSTYENTIEYILPWFIYDRTQEDVDRVQELRNKNAKKTFKVKKVRLIYIVSHYRLPANRLFF